jgi:SAM-dependent methyltransferase
MRIVGFVKQNRVLHVGCGGAPLPEWLGCNTEVRLDIVPDNNPDIVANMTDMGDIGEFDCIYCCHALEHLHVDDVNKALSEFHRVLKPGGKAIVFVPDLEGVRPTKEILFDSPAGPITGLDLMYGYNCLTKEKPYMRHLTGFVKESLKQALYDAGFIKVDVQPIIYHDMMGVATK